MSPTKKSKDKTPMKAMTPTKRRAPVKSPVALTMAPITIGVMIPAKLPIKLKTPPARPTARIGAISPTVVQMVAAIPLPKKAKVMKAITASGVLAKLAPMIVMVMIRPVTIGVLRAMERLAPCLIIESDQ